MLLPTLLEYIQIYINILTQKVKLPKPCVKNIIILLNFYVFSPGFISQLSCLCVRPRNNIFLIATPNLSNILNYKMML